MLDLHSFRSFLFLELSKVAPVRLSIPNEFRGTEVTASFTAVEQKGLVHFDSDLPLERVRGDLNVFDMFWTSTWEINSDLVEFLIPFLDFFDISLEK